MTRSTSILLLAILPALAAGQGTPPAVAQARGPEAHVLPLIGSDAVNCGKFDRGSMRTEGGLSAEELKAAADCITDAYRKGRAFYFFIGGVGIDSYVARGVAGVRNGTDLYQFAYDSAPCGGPSRNPGCGPHFGMARCETPPAAGAIDAEALCRLTLKQPERPKTPVVRAPGAPPVCEFPGLKLPEDYVVLGTGAYAGRTIGFQIDQSGHEATRIDVLVNQPAKPVVLVLGAYEPNIWNISWTQGTRIAAVLASGYHRQAIAGLDKNVPTLISSYDNKGACGYFYVGGDGIEKMNPLSRKLFDKPVELIYPAKNGSALIGEAVGANVRINTSKATPPESYYDKNAPIAGPAGLEDAVGKGLLRKATAADAEAWAEAVSQSTPRRDVPPVAGEGKPRARPGVYNAYVVLKPFTFPAGLYGGNSATFFVPQGVPVPQGNPGHSAVYDFNKMTCSGALCSIR
jgi:hypothetical protein